MGRNKWTRTTQESLKRDVKLPSKGIYWVEPEGDAFYWYTLDPMGKPVKCRGRYTKQYRAEHSAESFGYVKGTKPDDATRSETGQQTGAATGGTSGGSHQDAADCGED